MGLFNDQREVLVLPVAAAGFFARSDIVRGACSAPGAFGPSGSAGVVFTRPVVERLLKPCCLMLSARPKTPRLCRPLV